MSSEVEEGHESLEAEEEHSSLGVAEERESLVEEVVEEMSSRSWHPAPFLKKYTE